MRGAILKTLHPIKLDTIKQSFKEMKPIVDEKIIWFTYYNKEPIAFILAVPDINVILKPLKGKLNLLNKIRFIWLKKTTTIHRIRFIVMGCKKKFQNKGIESGMIRKLQLEVVPRNTITEAELAWVGDFNKKMIALHEATGAVTGKGSQNLSQNILKFPLFKHKFLHRLLCLLFLSSNRRTFQKLYPINENLHQNLSRRFCNDVNDDYARWVSSI